MLSGKWGHVQFLGWILYLGSTSLLNSRGQRKPSTIRPKHSWPTPGQSDPPPIPSWATGQYLSTAFHRLHIGWFNHINKQINNNEFNPINSNREKMINICMGCCITTLFIKYPQGKKKCLHNFSLFLKKMLFLIIWNGVFFFFLRLQLCCWLPRSFLESKTLMTEAWRKLSYFNLTVAFFEIQDVI